MYFFDTVYEEAQRDMTPNSYNKMKIGGPNQSIPENFSSGLLRDPGHLGTIRQDPNEQCESISSIRRKGFAADAQGAVPGQKVHCLPLRIVFGCE